MFKIHEQKNDSCKAHLTKHQVMYMYMDNCVWYVSFVSKSGKALTVTSTCRNFNAYMYIITHSIKVKDVINKLLPVYSFEIFLFSVVLDKTQWIWARYKCTSTTYC